MGDLWYDAAGARLFATEDGQGPLVVMLHGGMADHRTARPLVAPLAGRNRVVAPDVRGSGQSRFGGPLSFDRLADDVGCLLDHLGVATAIVGGASSGSGIALRFALRHPTRTTGLVLVKPVYAGAASGYTDQQAATLEAMDRVASRALEEGVQVLRPLYEGLPDGVRECALAMIETFDPSSVASTSRFLASGLQPFESAADLESLEMPVLVACGDDPMHPAGVSALYAAHIPDCTVVPVTSTDVARAIEAFAHRCL